MPSRTDAYLRDRRRYDERMSRMATRTPVEPAKPNAPPPEAIIAVTLSQMRRAQDDLASKNGELRSTYAKASANVHLKAAKRALQVAKTDKAEEYAEELEATLRYLRVLRVDLRPPQMDLFDSTSRIAPIEEKAFEDGLFAGRFGEPEDTNPHELSTKAGQKWLEAHRRGAEERKRVFSMQAEAEVIAAGDDHDDDHDDDAADGDGDAPFGEEWPDDREVSARHAEGGA